MKENFVWYFLVLIICISLVFGADQIYGSFKKNSKSQVTGKVTASPAEQCLYFNNGTYVFNLIKGEKEKEWVKVLGDSFSKIYGIASFKGKLYVYGKTPGPDYAIFSFDGNSLDKKVDVDSNFEHENEWEYGEGEFLASTEAICLVSATYENKNIIKNPNISLCSSDGDNWNKIKITSEQRKAEDQYNSWFITTGEDNIYAVFSGQHYQKDPEVYMLDGDSYTNILNPDDFKNFYRENFLMESEDIVCCEIPCSIEDCDHYYEWKSQNCGEDEDKVGKDKCSDKFPLFPSITTRVNGVSKGKGPLYLRLKFSRSSRYGSYPNYEYDTVVKYDGGLIEVSDPQDSFWSKFLGFDVISYPEFLFRGLEKSPFYNPPPGSTYPAHGKSCYYNKSYGIVKRPYANNSYVCNVDYFCEGGDCEYRCRTFYSYGSMTPVENTIYSIVDDYIFKYENSKFQFIVSELPFQKPSYYSWRPEYEERLAVFDCKGFFDESPIVDSIDRQGNSFSCSAHDDVGLTNISIYIWNKDGIFYSKRKEVNTDSASLSASVDTLPPGEYEFNCKATDTKKQSSFYKKDSNFTISGSGLEKTEKCLYAAVKDDDGWRSDSLEVHNLIGKESGKWVKVIGNESFDINNSYYWKTKIIPFGNDLYILAGKRVYVFDGRSVKLSLNKSVDDLKKSEQTLIALKEEQYNKYIRYVSYDGKDWEPFNSTYYRGNWDDHKSLPYFTDFDNKMIFDINKVKTPKQLLNPSEIKEYYLNSIGFLDDPNVKCCEYSCNDRYSWTGKFNEYDLRDYNCEDIDNGHIVDKDKCLRLGKDPSIDLKILSENGNGSIYFVARMSLKHYTGETYHNGNPKYNFLDNWNLFKLDNGVIEKTDCSSSFFADSDCSKALCGRHTQIENEGFADDKFHFVTYKESQYGPSYLYNSSCEAVKGGFCGDGIIGPGEECDPPREYAGRCNGFGFAEGRLMCNENCQYDFSQCHTCGNGILEGPEKYERGNFKGKTCESFGFDGGFLMTYDCQEIYDYTCQGCGDTWIDYGETCDSRVFDLSCSDFGLSGGNVSCGNDCHIDTGLCSGSSGVCGDNKINPGEECDGTNLSGMNCSTFGFYPNENNLTCNNCKINTSMCTTCGDRYINEGEECDFRNFGSKTCKDFGFDGGQLKCNIPGCTVNTSDCYNKVCGDGKAVTGESCDGSDLRERNCDDFGFDGGQLGCTDNCHFDVSQCNPATERVPFWEGSELGPGDGSGIYMHSYGGSYGGNLPSRNIWKYNYSNSKMILLPDLRASVDIKNEYGGGFYVGDLAMYDCQKRPFLFVSKGFVFKENGNLTENGTKLKNLALEDKIRLLIRQGNQSKYKQEPGILFLKSLDSVYGSTIQTLNEDTTKYNGKTTKQFVTDSVNKNDWEVSIQEINIKELPMPVIDYNRCPSKGLSVYNCDSFYDKGIIH